MLQDLLTLPASPLALLAFPVLAALLTQLSARLVGQAANAVEPVDRHLGFVRVAGGIGSLAWMLDVSGLLIFARLDARHTQLWPAMLALCIMLVSTRFSIPALASTRQRRHIVLAGVGLATGYIASHVALLAAFNVHLGRDAWPLLLAAWLVGGGMVVMLALRARSRRLFGNEGVLPLVPAEILVAGAAMLGQQLLLAQLPPSAGVNPGGAIHLPLLVLGLFAVLISAEQLFGQRIEITRQRLFDRALGRPHTVRAERGSADHRRLAMIAERAELLLQAPHLRLYFQPITPLDGQTRSMRFEALLRLHDDELGRIDPEQFLLACERMNLTARADRAIISQALHCSAQWLHTAQDCSGISVNVSHETLLDADFLPWVRAQLLAGGWPYGWLQLEITEHAMITHAGRLAGVLQELRTLGVGAVMDDFGAGFSCLGSLVDLPIQGIKCDRSLVRTLSGDPARQTLLQHLCALAGELGLTVTVEGVETQADLGIVRDKGAATVQGYVFARPMPHEDVPRWLRESAPQAA